MEITRRWDIRELLEGSDAAAWAGSCADPDAARSVFTGAAVPVPNAYLDLAERYREVNGRYPERFPDLPTMAAAREAVTRLWIDGLL